MNVDNNSVKVKNQQSTKGQARILCPYTLANNLDTLKVSFWVSWQDDTFLDEIASIKESLQKTDNDHEYPYHCPGGFDWNVQRIGIKLYSYRLLSGDLRLFINNRSAEGDVPNVRLEIGSESCWAPGYNIIYDRFIKWLHLLGGKVEKEIISEVHLALDIVGLYIGDINVHDEDFWIKRARKFDVYKENRNLTGITFGRDSCSLTIYDKVFEISRSGNKQETFTEFWEVSHFSQKPVTRIEFKLHRKLLKTLKQEDELASSVDTLNDLNSSLNSIWHFCTTDRARHCSKPVKYSNNHHTRSKNSEFWNIVNSVRWVGDKHITQQKPRPKKDLSALRKQYAGIAMSIAAFYGVNSEDLDHIVDISKYVIEEDLINLYRYDEPGFIKKVDKKKREVFESVSALHTLKPDHPEYGVYPTPYGFETTEGEPYA
ncbi:hypothetical protein [Desulfopila sp. IMCC35008]|uniref:hypothetical protein n=1 Tax=Desulfopila sp. IMCC35008 TaxID=2653858 RepID=UPI0013D1EE1F|nr:hypothetical protein [Desulfopila sp. IMCC35008]